MDNSLVELYKCNKDDLDIQKMKNKAIAVGLFEICKNLKLPLKKIFSSCTENSELKFFVQSTIFKYLKNEIHNFIYDRAFLLLKAQSSWKSIIGRSRNFSDAAKSGNTKEALTLLNKYDIQPVRIIDGIFHASIAGHTETLLILLPEIKSEKKMVLYECAFLISLIYNNNKTTISIFDQNKGFLNLDNFFIIQGISALMLCTLSDNANLLSQLLSRGVNPNIFAYSCLSQAEHFGYEDCRSFLISANSEKGNLFIDYDEIKNRVFNRY